MARILTDAEKAMRVRQIAALFGKGLTDKEIALKLRMSWKTVGVIRRENGLLRERAAPIKFEDRKRVEALHADGLPDPEIARRTGISSTSVRHHRAALNLPPHDANAWRSEQRKLQVSLCHGEGLTDEETAEKLGICNDWAKKLRCELGLPPNKSQPDKHALSQSEARTLLGLRRLFATDRPSVSEALAGRIMAASVAQEPQR